MAATFYRKVPAALEGRREPDDHDLHRGLRHLFQGGAPGGRDHVHDRVRRACSSSARSSRTRGSWSPMRCCWASRRSCSSSSRRSARSWRTSGAASCRVTVSPTAVVVVSVFYFIAFNIEGSILVPTFQGRMISFSGACVLVLITIGFALAGIIGAIVALPVAAIVRDIFGPVLRAGPGVRGAAARPRGAARGDDASSPPPPPAPARPEAAAGSTPGPAGAPAMARAGAGDGSVQSITLARRTVRDPEEAFRGLHSSADRRPGGRGVPARAADRARRRARPVHQRRLRHLRPRQRRRAWARRWRRRPPPTAPMRCATSRRATSRAWSTRPPPTPSSSAGCAPSPARPRSGRARPTWSPARRWRPSTACRCCCCPGDIFATRRVTPVLQQLERPDSQDVTRQRRLPAGRRATGTASTGPEQLLTALPGAMRVLTSPGRDRRRHARAAPGRAGGGVRLPGGAVRGARLGRAPAAPGRGARSRAPRTLIARRAAAADRRRRRRASTRRRERGARRVREPLGIPVAETQAGKGALPWDHPLNARRAGRDRRPGGQRARRARPTWSSRSAPACPTSPTAQLDRLAGPGRPLRGHQRRRAATPARRARLPLVADARAALEELARGARARGCAGSTAERRAARRAPARRAGTRRSTGSSTSPTPQHVSQPRGDPPGQRGGRPGRRPRLRGGRPAGRPAQAVAVAATRRLPHGVRLLHDGLRGRRRHGRGDGRAGPARSS